MLTDTLFITWLYWAILLYYTILYMTQITVYASEYFRRSKIWYILFSLFFIWLIVLSILSNNIVWAILLLFLLGWYLFFSISNRQLVTISIKDQSIQIWSMTYNRSNFSGYSLEIDSQTHIVATIIFISPTNQKLIHTITDQPDNIERFIVEINQYLPLQQQVSRTFTEKLIRTLQL